MNVNIIRQPFPFFAAPDFRNISVLGKCLLAVLVLMLVLPLITPNLNQQPYQLRVYGLALWMAPASLISLGILMLANQIIHASKVPPLWVWVVVVAVFGACNYGFNPHSEFFGPQLWAVALFTLALLHYHAVMRKALSPALAQAQLTALTARIRPHFLFNSLNAAISLVRTRPHDAEMVLENLADLFRAQLKEATQTNTLSKEIELAKSYIAIEQIRMGSERLQVVWEIDSPPDAQTPHLFLQPLLENAVMHGIEPAHRPGVITVRIVRRSEWIYLRIENPIPQEGTLPARRAGNGMAMSNLAQRLQLMYDQDALLKYQSAGKVYRVDMRIPYRRLPTRPR